MINYYFTRDGKLDEIESAIPGSWVSVIDPSPGEVTFISNTYDIGEEELEVVLDMDERSRISSGNGYHMIIVNFPIHSSKVDKEYYATIPMSIILTENNIITLSSFSSPAIETLIKGNVKNFDTNKPSRFILQLLNEINALYLQYLKEIDSWSSEVESKLIESTQNKELFELLKLQKSLVYFTTALSSNEIVLDKLLRTELLKRFPEDSELLEDVLVENKQAIEMADIYTEILSGTVDTFASVISNNLNIVMKALAVITIVLSIPTMIFSAYGMNLHIAGVPFGQHPWGFVIIIALSVLISAIVSWIFVKLKLF